MLLKNKEVYIVGSGASIDFFPPNFFDDKIVIALNEMHELIDADYIIKTSKMFWKEGSILRKGSTAEEAMKWAAEEGAKAMFLCGVDMGGVGGEAFAKNYHGIYSIGWAAYMQKDNLKGQQ